MNTYYQDLEDELRLLLGSLENLTSSDLSEVEEYLQVGEYGVAFETLCSIIKSIGVTDVLRPRSLHLAKKMDIDPIWWKEIT